MAQYPGEDGESRYSEAILRSVVSEIFQACGMSLEDAVLLANSLVHADVRGIHSHGVLRVPDYVQKLRRDGVDPRGRPRVVSEVGGAIVIDAHNSMGQIAGTFAMRKAIEKAKSLGIAFAAVRGSNHSGALDYYTMMALRENMIGITGTNALPTMAPWGGTDKIVGLNPLSLAIPAGRTEPIVLDAALGATAHGKIRVYAQKGFPIPEGWAFDASGRPTTDAAAALEGLIQPIGGHKGIGLAIMVGILSSVLSGAGYGTESGNMVDGAKPGADGQFYIAINIAAFRPITDFKEAVDRLATQYNGTALAPGFDRVFTPGALEAEVAARNRQLGIPLNNETVRLIEASARELGLASLSLRQEP